jgi:tetratricopeptide (TPR) repeat protein
MTTKSETAPYQNSPVYKEALGYFQRGDWENGLRSLKKVIDEYPLELELQQVRQQMELRSRLEVEEHVEDKKKYRRNLFLAGVRFSILAVVLLAFVWVGSLSIGLIQEQIQKLVEETRVDYETVLMMAWRKNAKELFAAGRAEEAMVLVDRLKEKGVDDDELTKLEEELNLMLDTDYEYQTAKRLYNAGNYPIALPALEQLDQEKPNYRDVPLLIEKIYKSMYLESIVTNADAAYYSERWEEAITGYREISSLDPNYRREFVEERLFQSLVGAAKNLAANPEGSLKDLETIDGYLRQALVFRPQDKEVQRLRIALRDQISERLYWTLMNDAEDLLAENTDALDVLERVEEKYRQALELRPKDTRAQTGLDLARRFVRAQSDFDNGRWTQVIDGLEYVYNVDFNYARGTARHTLYEAYLFRGDGLAAGALYEVALEDYRKAAMLASQDTNADLKVYEAQTRLAEVSGLQGNYEDAVSVYRGAFELSGFGVRVQEESPALAAKLADAERNVANRNFQTAFRLYREVVNGSEAVYDTIKHTVLPGEYLTSIAARYRSTVSAIAELNNIANPNRINAGAELLIPVIPNR